MTSEDYDVAKLRLACLERAVQVSLSEPPAPHRSATIRGREALELAKHYFEFVVGGEG